MSVTLTRLSKELAKLQQAWCGGTADHQLARAIEHTSRRLSGDPSIMMPRAVVPASPSDASSSDSLHTPSILGSLHSPLASNRPPYSSPSTPTSPDTADSGAYRLGSPSNSLRQSPPAYSAVRAASRSSPSRCTSSRLPSPRLMAALSTVGHASPEAISAAATSTRRASFGCGSSPPHGVQPGDKECLAASEHVTMAPAPESGAPLPPACSAPGLLAGANSAIPHDEDEKHAEAGVPTQEQRNNGAGDGPFETGGPEIGAHAPPEAGACMNGAQQSTAEVAASGEVAALPRPAVSPPLDTGTPRPSIAAAAGSSTKPATTARSQLAATDDNTSADTSAATSAAGVVSVLHTVLTAGVEPPDDSNQMPLPSTPPHSSSPAEATASTIVARRATAMEDAIAQAEAEEASLLADLARRPPGFLPPLRVRLQQQQPHEQPARHQAATPWSPLSPRRRAAQSPEPQSRADRSRSPTTSRATPPHSDVASCSASIPHAAAGEGASFVALPPVRSTPTPDETSSRQGAVAIAGPLEGPPPPTWVGASPAGGAAIHPPSTPPAVLPPIANRGMVAPPTGRISPNVRAAESAGACRTSPVEPSLPALPSTNPGDTGATDHLGTAESGPTLHASTGSRSSSHTVAGPRLAAGPIGSPRLVRALASCNAGGSEGPADKPSSPAHSAAAPAAWCPRPPLAMHSSAPNLLQAPSAQSSTASFGSVTTAGELATVAMPSPPLAAPPRHRRPLPAGRAAPGGGGYSPGHGSPNDGGSPALTDIPSKPARPPESVTTGGSECIGPRQLAGRRGVSVVTAANASMASSPVARLGTTSVNRVNAVEERQAPQRPQRDSGDKAQSPLGTAAHSSNPDGSLGSDDDDTRSGDTEHPYAALRRRAAELAAAEAEEAAAAAEAADKATPPRCLGGAGAAAQGSDAGMLEQCKPVAMRSGARRGDGDGTGSAGKRAHSKLQADVRGHNGDADIDESFAKGTEVTAEVGTAVETGEECDRAGRRLSDALRAGEMDLTQLPPAPPKCGTPPSLPPHPLSTAIPPTVIALADIAAASPLPPLPPHFVARPDPDSLANATATAATAAAPPSPAPPAEVFTQSLLPATPPSAAMQLFPTIESPACLVMAPTIFGEEGAAATLAVTSLPPPPLSAEASGEHASPRPRRPVPARTRAAAELVATAAAGRAASPAGSLQTAGAGQWRGIRSQTPTSAASVAGFAVGRASLFTSSSSSSSLVLRPDTPASSLSLASVSASQRLSPPSPTRRWFPFAAPRTSSAGPSRLAHSPPPRACPAPLYGGPDASSSSSDEVPTSTIASARGGVGAEVGNWTDATEYSQRDNGLDGGGDNDDVGNAKAAGHTAAKAAATVAMWPPSSVPEPPHSARHACAATHGPADEGSFGRPAWPPSPAARAATNPAGLTASVARAAPEDETQPSFIGDRRHTCAGDGRSPPRPLACTSPPSPSSGRMRSPAGASPITSGDVDTAAADAEVCLRAGRSPRRRARASPPQADAGSRSSEEACKRSSRRGAESGHPDLPPWLRGSADSPELAANARAREQALLCELALLRARKEASRHVIDSSRQGAWNLGERADGGNVHGDAADHQQLPSVTAENAARNGEPATSSPTPGHTSPRRRSPSRRGCDLAAATTRSDAPSPAYDAPTTAGDDDFENSSDTGSGRRRRRLKPPEGMENYRPPRRGQFSPSPRRSPSLRGSVHASPSSTRDAVATAVASGNSGAIGEDSSVSGRLASAAPNWSPQQPLPSPSSGTRVVVPDETSPSSAIPSAGGAALSEPASDAAPGVLASPCATPGRPAIPRLDLSVLSAAPARPAAPSQTTAAAAAAEAIPASSGSSRSTVSRPAVSLPALPSRPPARRDDAAVAGTATAPASATAPGSPTGRVASRSPPPRPVVSSPLSSAPPMPPPPGRPADELIFDFLQGPSHPAPRDVTTADNDGAGLVASGAGRSALTNDAGLPRDAVASVADLMAMGPSLVLPGPSSPSAAAPTAIARVVTSPSPSPLPTAPLHTAPAASPSSPPSVGSLFLFAPLPEALRAPPPSLAATSPLRARTTRATGCSPPWAPPLPVLLSGTSLWPLGRAPPAPAALMPLAPPSPGGESVSPTNSTRSIGASVNAAISAQQKLLREQLQPQQQSASALVVTASPSISACEQAARLGHPAVSISPLPQPPSEPSSLPCLLSKAAPAASPSSPQPQPTLAPTSTAPPPPSLPPSTPPPLSPKSLALPQPPPSSSAPSPPLLPSAEPTTLPKAMSPPTDPAASPASTSALQASPLHSVRQTHDDLSAPPPSLAVAAGEPEAGAVDPTSVEAIPPCAAPNQRGRAIHAVTDGPAIADVGTDALAPGSYQLQRGDGAATLPASTETATLIPRAAGGNGEPPATASILATPADPPAEVTATAAAPTVPPTLGSDTSTGMPTSGWPALPALSPRPASAASASVSPTPPVPSVPAEAFPPAPIAPILASPSAVPAAADAPSTPTAADPAAVALTAENVQVNLEHVTPRGESAESRCCATPSPCIPNADSSGAAPLLPSACFPVYALPPPPSPPSPPTTLPSPLTRLSPSLAQSCTHPCETPAAGASSPPVSARADVVVQAAPAGPASAPSSSSAEQEVAGPAGLIAAASADPHATCAGPIAAQTGSPTSADSAATIAAAVPVDTIDAAADTPLPSACNSRDPALPPRTTHDAVEATAALEATAAASDATPPAECPSPRPLTSSRLLHGGSDTGEVRRPAETLRTGEAVPEGGDVLERVRVVEGGGVPTPLTSMTPRVKEVLRATVDEAAACWTKAAAGLAATDEKTTMAAVTTPVTLTPPLPRSPLPLPLPSTNEEEAPRLPVSPVPVSAAALPPAPVAAPTTVVSQASTALPSPAPLADIAVANNDASTSSLVPAASSDVLVAQLQVALALKERENAALLAHLRQLLGPGAAEAVLSTTAEVHALAVAAASIPTAPAAPVV